MRNFLLLVTMSATVQFLTGCSGRGEVEISGGASVEPGDQAADDWGRVDARPGRHGRAAAPGTSSTGGSGSGSSAAGSSGASSSGSTASSGGSNLVPVATPSPIEVGVGGGAHAHENALTPPDVHDRQCAAACKLEAQCGYAPKNCLDACHDHNWYVRHDFLAKEAACLETATCWEPGGACAHKAAKSLKHNYESDPMYQKCVHKRAECGAKIQDAECARYLFLHTPERDDVDTCLRQPCDTVGKCINQVLTHSKKN